MTRLVHIALVALVIACSAACGDDGGGAVDAGAAIDARRFADAGAIACGGDADAGCPAGRTGLCDPERGACVECVTGDDCAAAGALGPSCETAEGICSCADDAECTGRASGPRCHEVARACTCLTDEDCAGDATCELEPYLGAGVRTCVAPPT